MVFDEVFDGFWWIFWWILVFDGGFWWILVFDDGGFWWILFFDGGFVGALMVFDGVLKVFEGPLMVFDGVFDDFWWFWWFLMVLDGFRWFLGGFRWVLDGHTRIQNDHNQYESKERPQKTHRKAYLTSPLISQESSDSTRLAVWGDSGSNWHWLRLGWKPCRWEDNEWLVVEHFVFPSLVLSEECVLGPQNMLDWFVGWHPNIA